jgi:hypothetical protein
MISDIGNIIAWTLQARLLVFLYLFNREIRSPVLARAPQ